MRFSYNKPLKKEELRVLDAVRKDGCLPVTAMPALANAYGCGAADVAEKMLGYFLDECEHFADSARKNGIDAAVAMAREHLCRKIANFYDDGDDLMTMAKKSS